jgi:hypothetical protein
LADIRHHWLFERKIVIFEFVSVPSATQTKTYSNLFFERCLTIPCANCRGSLDTFHCINRSVLASLFISLPGQKDGMAHSEAPMNKTGNRFGSH